MSVTNRRQAFPQVTVIVMVAANWTARYSAATASVDFSVAMEAVVSGGVAEAAVCTIAGPAVVPVKSPSWVKIHRCRSNMVPDSGPCIVEGGGGGGGSTGSIGPSESTNEGCSSMETADICTVFVKSFSTSGMASSSTTTTVSDIRSSKWFAQRT